MNHLLTYKPYQDDPSKRGLRLTEFSASTEKNLNLRMHREGTCRGPGWIRKWYRGPGGLGGGVLRLSTLAGGEYQLPLEGLLASWAGSDPLPLFEKTSFLLR